MNLLKSTFLVCFTFFAQCAQVMAAGPGPARIPTQTQLFTYEFTGSYTNPITLETVTWPEVTVIGLRCSADFACTSTYNALVAQSNSAWQRFIDAISRPLPTVNRANTPSKFPNPVDIKYLCMVPGRAEAAHTTSKDEWERRHDAAHFIVGANSAYWMGRMIAARLGGTAVVVDGIQRIRATVVFADGGSEDFLVNAVATDNADPIDGTLKLGDGVAKNVPC